MIVGILGPGGCGGSFLDWTLHYLSGDIDYRQVDCRGPFRAEVAEVRVIELLDSPFLNNTAHRHIRSHPSNHSVDQVIKLLQRSESALDTFYYVEHLSPHQTKTTYNSLITKYPEIRFIRFVFDSKDVDAIFYLQYEKIEYVQNVFCERIPGKNINEFREQLSLYYPGCIAGQTINEEHISANNVLDIKFNDMITNLSEQIQNIFLFLGINIDQSRLDMWSRVYQQWQEISGILFFNDLTMIVDAINNGIPMDLSKYNMTFAKEVVVSSNLLYTCNKSLKIDMIDRLSDNTQQWIQVLEENIYHNLKDKK